MVKLTQLRESYIRAIETGQTIIVIDGREVLASYLKYLIEHLEAQKVGDDVEIELTRRE